MTRNLMSTTAQAALRKIAFAILCVTLLTLVAAPAWATEVAQTDPCTTPTTGTTTPAGSVDYDTAGNCTVVITITGTTGNLTATISQGLYPYAYDADEDQLVGIVNNSSVTVGAIRLSGPPTSDPIFAFDGDGPCEFEAYSWCPAGYYGPDSGSTSPIGYQGPNNTFVGISPDLTTGTVSFSLGGDTPIPPGGSTWFALEYLPAAVVSIGETQTQVTGQTNIFPFAPFACTSDGCSGGSGTWTEMHTTDDAQFTPVGGISSPGADTWTLLPVPLPAGPLGNPPTFGTFGSFGFSMGDFGTESPSAAPTYGPLGFATNFSPAGNTLACVPYSDYSSANNPMCVEIERDCIGPDCTTVVWTSQLDYDIDPDSIYGPIGGPSLPEAPGIQGPTSPGTAAPGGYDFAFDTLSSYTGAAPVGGGDPPPPKGGGSDGKSVFVSAFSPALSVSQPIPVGTTVGFPGFEAPWVNTNSPSCTSKPPVNCIVDLEPILLGWDYTTTSGTPITNLQLCLTISSPGACATPKGVTAPWVQVSSIPVNSACGSFTGANPLPGIFANLGKIFPKVGSEQGQYTFLTDAFVLPKGCEVSVVLTWSNGTIAAPAVWVYAN